jgi:HEPN domain-containing protein
LPVIESLFEKRHFVWSLFIAHLALEKIIKANYVKNEQQTPPKTHNLTAMAGKASLSLTNQQITLLDEVSGYHVEARYPDYKQSMQKVFNKERTRQKLDEILGLYAWLKQQATQSN